MTSTKTTRAYDETVRMAREGGASEAEAHRAGLAAVYSLGRTAGARAAASARGAEGAPARGLLARLLDLGA